MLAEGVIAGEQPVLAADRHAFERPLGCVVVDVQPAGLAVAIERFPLVERIAGA